MTDFTADLQQLCHDMYVGQLLHSPSFQLKSAMCAVQIMDPRMDTGIVTPKKPANVSQAPEDFDIYVLRFLAGWLSGRCTLAQSLFLIEDFENQHTLQVIIRGVLGIVNVANVNYEEDLSIDCFGQEIKDYELQSDQGGLENFLYSLNQIIVKSAQLQSVALELKEVQNFIDTIDESLPSASLALESYPVQGLDIGRMAIYLSTQPPRSTLLPSLQETKSLFRGLFGTIEELQTLKSDRTSLAHILEWLRSGVLKRKCTLSRSIMRLWLGFDDQVMSLLSLNQLIANDVVKFSQAPYFKKPKDLVSQFLSSSSQILRQIFRLYCLNEGRVRRHLYNVTLLIDQLQIQCEGVYDAQLQDGDQFYFSGWVLSLKLQTMQEYIWLGFDLDLYQNWELPVIYWHLEYLYNMELENIDRAAKHQKLKFDIYRVVILTKLEQCRAYCRFYAALHGSFVWEDNHGFVPQNFDQALKSLFQYRFGKFSKMSSPIPITVEQYYQVFANVDRMQLLKTALMLFENYKKYVQVIQAKYDKQQLDFRGWSLSEMPRIIKDTQRQVIVCNVLISMSDTQIITINKLEGRTPQFTVKSL